jgi:hypothetical protein
MTAEFPRQPQIKAPQEIFNNENLLQDIKEKVQYARTHPASLKLIEKEASIDGFLSQSDKEFLAQATIRVQTIVEYRIVLELLLDAPGEAEEVAKTLAHENAHANVAESLGARVHHYLLTIIRDGQEMYLSPSVDFSVPEEWSEAKRKEVYLAIIKAPEEYGETLSPDDKKQIENIDIVQIASHSKFD